MFGYDRSDLRQIAMSAAMTLLFSATCLVAAVAPVRAEQGHGLPPAAAPRY